MMFSLALLLPWPLLAAEDPAPPPAAAVYDIQVDRASPAVRDGKAMIVAEGTTNLPTGVILKGTLHYQLDSKLLELVSGHRVEVKDGAFSLPLYVQFSAGIFPGIYQITITPDASQPLSIRDQLDRKIRLLRRTKKVPIGTPDDARAAERKLRQTWREAFSTMGALGQELGRAYQQYKAAPFNPAAWGAWKEGWSSRLAEVQKLTLGAGESAILPNLNADWQTRSGSPPSTFLEGLGHLLRDVASYCETALRADPRNPVALQRAQQWLARYHQHYQTTLPNLPLLRLGRDEMAEILARLRVRLQDVQDWFQGWNGKAPGHAASDWPAWYAAWLEQVNRELNQMGGGTGRQGMLEALQNFALRTIDLRAAAEKTLSGEGGTPADVSPAVEDARRALSAIEENLPAE